MSTCIRDGCGTPFDSTEPETRATETLRAFYFRYCPKHRVRPDHESNPVITETRAKPTFTPGPWETETGRSVWDKKGWTICTVNHGTFGTDGMKANAKLIAAAPELLAALIDLQKELRAVLKFDVKKHYSLMVADAVATKAVRKAEGR